MKAVLVAGSSGLVGSACVRLLAHRDWRVVGIDNNMRGYDLPRIVEELVERNAAERVANSSGQR